MEEFDSMGSDEEQQYIANVNPQRNKAEREESPHPYLTCREQEPLESIIYKNYFLIEIFTLIFYTVENASELANPQFKESFGKWLKVLENISN